MCGLGTSCFMFILTRWQAVRCKGFCKGPGIREHRVGGGKTDKGVSAREQG